MAHNIAQINGQDAIAYLDATPWHGLGTKLQLAGLDKSQLIDAALDAAQLRWTAGSVPMFLADGTQVPGYSASVRYASDGSGKIEEIFAPVGTGYTHSQNVENVEILRTLAEDFGHVPAAAGALRGGGRCWFLMRAAEGKLTPIDGDEVNGYFLMHWGHDGDAGISLMPTGVRVVCQNTLNMAVGNGGRSWLTIRHTSSVAARRDEAAKLVRKLAETLKATGETYAQMARTVISAEQVANYIAKVIPNTDPGKATLSPVIVARRDTVARLVYFGRGAAMANQLADTRDGSASVWGVLNGITEYYDHVRTAEAQSPAGLQRAQESAIFGGNAALKSQAFVAARELVAV